MESRANEKKTSPVKWAAVGVLALVMGYLILRPNEPISPQPVASAGVKHNKPAPSAKVTAAVNHTRSIKTNPLAIVRPPALLAYNPFEFDGGRISAAATATKPPSSPNASSRSLAAQVQKQINAMRTMASQGVVDIILDTRNGRTARIGKTIVQEGSRLNTGVSIQRIQKDGVLIELTPQLETQPESSKKE